MKARAAPGQVDLRKVRRSHHPAVLANRVRNIFICTGVCSDLHPEDERIGQRTAR